MLERSAAKSPSGAGRSPVRGRSGWSWLLGPLLGMLLPGCAHSNSHGAEPVRGMVSARAPLSTGSHRRSARLFALPELSPQETAFSVEPDGTRELVLRGMRLLDHPSGALERADELLPAGRSVKALQLPARFGGGYVFAVGSSGGADLWRARDWLAKLEPVAHLDFEVERMVAGFDRLYLFDRRTEAAALDLESGSMVDLGTLPASPGYASMAFADAWLGAVDVPFRGVLVSFDAGASWNPLGVRNASAVALDHDEVVITTPRGAFALDDSGVLRPRAQRGTEADALFSDLRVRAGAVAVGVAGRSEPAPAHAAFGALGRRPLREAVLRGIADAEGTALVAENGALVRVRLADGELLAVHEHAYAGVAPCQGIVLESGVGFVCGEERGGTTIYRVSPELSLARRLSFDQPRFVAPSGNGALVVRGSCRYDEPGPAGTYCVRSRSGQLREVRVRGDRGVERVVALSDGGVALLVPPRLGMPGTLSLVHENGTARSIALRLPKTDDKVKQSLLRKGLWLDGFVEAEPGLLSGWVAAAGPFAGVKVHLDGRVEVSQPQHDIDRALLGGRFALLLSGSGLASQSVDNGFTWRELELTNELPGDDAMKRSEGAPLEQGCSALGCAFGSWLRVGWSGKHESGEAMAAPPRAVSRLLPGGGRWAYRCEATQEASARARAVTRTRVEEYGTGGLGLSGIKLRPRARSLEKRVENVTWPGFFELPPPARRASDLGFDVGTENKAVQVHGYIWGPRSGSWERAGRWQLSVADPFDVRGAWSTLASASPWSDSAVAAQVFGADTSGPSNWDATLDPAGSGGALVIVSRGTVELFLFEKERGITRVRDVARFGFFSLSGVVKLGATWYLGIEAGTQEFRILKVEGDRASVLGEYPLHQLGRAPLRVGIVRNNRASALGLWARGKGFYVFPVDTEKGTTGAPLEVTPAALSRTPRACTSDDEGWVLKTAPSDTGRDMLEPNLAVGESRVGNIEVRLIVSATATCVSALAAQSETAVLTHGTPIGAEKNTVPLVLTERVSGGRRLGFRCSQ